MWISREKYISLITRIERLEENLPKAFLVTVASADEYENVPDSWGGYFKKPKTSYISVQSVIEQICNHLGLELKYVPGAPEKLPTVAIEKISKKK